MEIMGIGGGDIRVGQTLPLDRLILELTGSPRPRVLFLPTASNDDPGYVEAFTCVYGQALGADTDALLLTQGPGRQEISERIAWAEAIYVGGGNTRALVRRWREAGVDEMLRKAGLDGTILSGLSAGLNCWFRFCNSDAPQLEGVPGVLTERVEGLGFVGLTVCPHYDGEAFRPSEFRRMMAATPGPGLALDDCCAIHVRDGSFRIVAARDAAVAHLVWSVGGEVLEETIEPFSDFRPLSWLSR